MILVGLRFYLHFLVSLKVLTRFKEHCIVVVVVLIEQ